MPIDGKPTLDEITITDADLEARYLTVKHYYAEGRSDFSVEIAAATSDALDDFSSQASGVDPKLVVPDKESQWKQVLVYYTLTAILQGASVEETDRVRDFRDKAETLRKELPYRVDWDESGTLDDTLSEARTKIQQTRLYR